MVKYRLTNIKAKCPVCGKTKGKLLYEVSSTQSARHFILEEAERRRFNKLQKNIEKLWQGKNCKIVRCENCCFCYAYPYIAGDLDFYNTAFGKGDYPFSKFEYEITFRVIKKLIKKLLKSNVQLLELAGGDGAFIKKISPILIPKKNILCLEYSRNNVNQIRNYGVPCILKDVREINDSLYKHKFSIICLFQILEHMDNLDKLFKSLNFLSAKKVDMFIAVPNAERIEFNEKNGALLDMPPNHIGRWNKECFKIIGKKYQWKIVDYKIEPGKLTEAINQFSSYKYLRNKQVFKSIDNRIAIIRNKKILKILKKLRIAYYKIFSWGLIKKNYQKIGNSQWIHFFKIKDD